MELTSEPRVRSASYLIIGVVNNGFLTFEHHDAGRYARFVENADMHKLTGNEGHVVFVNPCKHNHEALGVPLCEDREGVHRVAVQRGVADGVVKFLGLRCDYGDREALAYQTFTPGLLRVKARSNTFSDAGVTRGLGRGRQANLVRVEIDKG